MDDEKQKRRDLADKVHDNETQQKQMLATMEAMTKRLQQHGVAAAAAQHAIEHLVSNAVSQSEYSNIVIMSRDGKQSLKTLHDARAKKESFLASDAQAKLLGRLTSVGNHGSTISIRVKLDVDCQSVQHSLQNEIDKEYKGQIKFYKGKD